MIITSADFQSGEFKIAQNQYTNLDQYLTANDIDRAIKWAIGFELGSVYNASDARFIAIRDYISAAKPEGCLGLKFIIQAFLFGHIMSTTNYLSTTTGDKVVISDGLQNTRQRHVILHNRAVTERKVLAAYLQENRATYPEYVFRSINYLSLY